jgi:hypothetical protein
MNGVVFKTTEARRFQDRPTGPMQIRIDHNSHLSLVESAGDSLKVEFQFTTSYGALGVIKLEGTLGLTVSDAAGAAAEYAKTRNLPPEVAQQVHGAILQACIPEAVGLAKGIRLPPPIPLPQVKIGQSADAQAQAASPIDSPEVG